MGGTVTAAAALRCRAARKETERVHVEAGNQTQVGRPVTRELVRMRTESIGE